MYHLNLHTLWRRTTTPSTDLHLAILVPPGVPVPGHSEGGVADPLRLHQRQGAANRESGGDRAGARGRRQGNQPGPGG